MYAREGIDSKYFPVSIGMRFGNHQIGPSEPEKVLVIVNGWMDGLVHVQVKIPGMRFHRSQIPLRESNVFIGVDLFTWGGIIKCIT